MTQKTNTNNEVVETVAEAVATTHTAQDVRNAILIVSLLANLVIFTMWVAMQVTYRYDAQIASFLFDR